MTDSPGRLSSPQARETAKLVFQVVLVSACAAAVLALAGLPPGYPVNDAAAYHRMAQLWHLEGHPVFIGWNEMTLLGHLAPAVALSRLGAHSIIARQLLVGLSAVIVTVLTWILAARLGLKPRDALPTSLSWLGNPVTLLCSTSFMTETPHAMWTLAWLAAFTSWFQRGGAFAAAGWAACAVAAFSVRQTGVVLPAAAVVVALVLKRRRLTTVVIAAITVALDGMLWMYRGSLPLSSIRPLTELLIDPSSPMDAVATICRHSAEALTTLGIWLIPVAATTLATRPRAAVNRWGALLAAGAASVIIACASWFPFWPNTITRNGLLPDTLPPHAALPPVLPEWIWIVLTALGVLCVATLSSRVFHRDAFRNPTVLAATVVIAGYIAVLAITRSPFDRYLVPVVPLAVVATAILPSSVSRSTWPAPVVAMLAVALIASATSTAGLHERQRSVWRLAQDQVDEGVPPTAVDGGFEWNLWHQQVPFSPSDALDPRSTLVWYESYPFTRMKVERRLWIGPPPPGWRELSNRRIPGGHQVLVVVPTDRPDAVTP